MKTFRQLWKSLLMPSLALGLLGFSARSVVAQWIDQPITLRPGWNAIFLEVQPDAADCDVAFASLPVESVWRYNHRQAVVQFIADPNELVISQPDWLTWVPPSNPLTDQTSLHFLEGGRPYLIKMADNAPTNTWNVRGKPVLRSIEWLRDSYNFVGATLPSASPPTYRTFCSYSSALSETNLYRLLTSGSWQRVTSPGTTAMQRGEAFWTRTRGLPAYSGPIEVQTDRHAGLEFGRILTEQTIRIRNVSTNSTVISIRPLTSTNPPATSGIALAGPVPMGYWRNSSVFTNVGWITFSGVVQSNLPPGGIWDLRLEVRRREMAAFTPPSGATDSLYQSLLEITDSANGTRALVPVSAYGPQSASAALAGGRSLMAASATTPPRAGLWVGTATINQVNQPGSGNPAEPVPTASEFSFRLMVHLDASGQARLLQKILQVWSPGTYKSAGDGTTNLVVDRPGRFVLLTDDNRVGQFAGAALRDGTAVARRFSSAAFGFRGTIPMNGTGFGDAGNQLACIVPLPFDDSLNPFVHRFHPDHDNRDDRPERNPLLPHTNSAGLTYTAESWSINRAITLIFSADDPDLVSQNLSGWGDNRLGGSYTETIYGLHKTPLVTRGTFRLHLASRVALLEP